MKVLIRNEFEKIVESKFVWILFMLILLYQGKEFSIFYKVKTGLLIPSYAITENGETLSFKEGLNYNQKLINKYKGVLTDDLISRIFSESILDSNQKIIAQTAVSKYINRMFVYQKQRKSVEDVYPNIDFPLSYGYSDSWEAYYYDTRLLYQIISFLLIVALAPIFSYEYQSGAAVSILTSKNGRTKGTKAKIIASLLFANIVTVFFMGLQVILYYIYFGCSGWDTSIQVGYMCYFNTSPININYLKLMWVSLLLALMAYNVIAVFTLIVSGKCENTFQTIIITLILYFIPNPDFYTNEVYNPLLRSLFCLFPINALNIRLPILCKPINAFGHSLHIYMLVFIWLTILLAGGSYSAYRIFHDKKNM